MTNEEAVRKLEYSKTAYQMLIDEKVDSGKLVGKDVKGEWKADTPLDEAYKSMIEALEMGIKAIKVLEQEPCEDAIRRADAEALFRNARSKLNPSDYKTADEFNTRNLMLLNAEQFIHLLPSVRPQEPKTGHWIDIDGGVECDKCGKWYPHAPIAKSEIKFCSECGAKMVEPQERSGEE